MEIKLSGAFAGYFALVLLITYDLPKISAVVSPSPSHLGQVWEVEGQVVDQQGNAIQPLSAADIKFEPDILVLSKNGWFKATFATQLTRTAEVWSSPVCF
jgi:hypothetical protein